MRNVPYALYALSAALLALTVSAFRPRPLSAPDAASRNASASVAGDAAKPFLHLAPEPEGVARIAAGERLDTPVCPGNAISRRVACPQGIDGGVPVDEAVSARAERMTAQARASFLEYAERPEDCAPLDNGQLRPGRGGLQGLGQGAPGTFRLGQVLGRPQSGKRIRSMNIAADGTELAAADLFADPAKSRPLLWERSFRSACSGDRGTAPCSCGSPACSGDPGPAFPRRLSPESTLDGMGHAPLTSPGFTVSLDPYEAWAWATVPSVWTSPRTIWWRWGRPGAPVLTVRP
ncbi:MAG: hypothetical protein LBQ79_01025 [Deltaproteobacteria bacterium]|jgi:hypothetical protein|nr:hypothetical protein [Deltaproteobacteria bacterium]